MKLLWRKTTTKVFGDAHSKNEDVFLPHSSRKEDINRFVMCDGATSSYASCAWAEILASEFVSSTEMSVRDRVYAAAKQYEAKYPISSLAGMNHSEIEAFKRGSSATLLLLEQTSSESSRIHVKAVGDTCVFVLDGKGQVLKSFPLEAAEQFSTSAHLVTVTFEGLKQLFDEQTKDYYWKETDIDLSEQPDSLLLCATDAVSQWIMARRDRPAEIKRLLKAVKRPGRDKFVRFIEHERKAGAMQTDDSTVAVIRP
ncbi:MAG: hypothetical protein IJI36_19865 [Kiritimatiellae bacterium]|nr:hypothetical protein [Kiritimatiellia bacterium]